MRCVEGIQNGDIIGVAMQQSGEWKFLAPNSTNSVFRCNTNNLLYLSILDLPMLQFFHNGEPLYDIAVNRYVIELDKELVMQSFLCFDSYIIKFIMNSMHTDFGASCTLP